jgi:hypothetical protein
MVRFNHYGVPVVSVVEGCSFVEELGVYVTDYAQDPMAMEFLYVPKDSSIVPAELRTQNHIAYDTDEFDAILSKSKVLYQFLCPKDNKTRMAFVNYKDAIVELKEVE